MTDPPELGQDPAWGSLPAEQFLIRHWDVSSPLKPAEQQSQLVKEFLRKDNIPSNVSRLVTAEEIRDILEPWRPAKLRQIALAHVLHSGSYFSILRTYYGGGAEDDQKLKDWLELTADDFPPPQHYWWTVLDDPAFFDVGASWGAVLEILPELAKPVNSEPFDAKVELNEIKEELAEDYREEPSDEDVFDELLMRSCFGYPLIIIDKNAFSTGKLGLVFLDAKGDIVKESEMLPQDMSFLAIAYEQAKLQTSMWWQRGVVTSKYEKLRELLS